MKSALIINCCYTSNFGDQAIGMTMKALFESFGYEVDLYDLVQVGKHFDGELQYDENKVRPLSLEAKFFANKDSLKAKFSKHLNLLKWAVKNGEEITTICKKKYDIAIFGGGELVQSNGIFPFAIDLWIKKLQKQTKIYFFGVGATKIYSKTDYRKLQKALNKSDAVFVRDQNSQKNVREVFSCESELIADVVLGAHSCNFERQNNKKILYGMTSFSRIARYGFENLKTRREYYEYCYRDLERAGYLKEPSLVNLLYADIYDFSECYSFSSYLQNEYGITVSVLKIQTFRDFEKEIASCNMVISPRMHACIFGLLYGKQTKLVCISEKTKSFCHEYMNTKVTLDDYQNAVRRAASKLNV